MKLYTIIWAHKLRASMLGSQNLIMHSPVCHNFSIHHTRNAFSMGRSEHCSNEALLDQMRQLIAQTMHLSGHYICNVEKCSNPYQYFPQTNN